MLRTQRAPLLFLYDIHSRFTCAFTNLVVKDCDKGCAMPYKLQLIRSCGSCGNKGCAMPYKIATVVPTDASVRCKCDKGCAMPYKLQQLDLGDESHRPRVTKAAQCLTNCNTLGSREQSPLVRLAKAVQCLRNCNHIMYSSCPRRAES